MFKQKENNLNNDTLEAINECIKIANDNTDGHKTIDELKKALGV